MVLRPIPRMFRLRLLVQLAVVVLVIPMWLMTAAPTRAACYWVGGQAKIEDGIRLAAVTYYYGTVDYTIAYDCGGHPLQTTVSHFRVHISYNQSPGGISHTDTQAGLLSWFKPATANSEPSGDVVKTFNADISCYGTCDTVRHQYPNLTMGYSDKVAVGTEILGCTYEGGAICVVYWQFLMGPHSVWVYTGGAGCCSDLPMV